MERGALTEYNDDNNIIYTTEDGLTKIDVTYEEKTVWLAVA